MTTLQKYDLLIERANRYVLTLTKNELRKPFPQYTIYNEDGTTDTSNRPSVLRFSELVKNIEACKRNHPQFTREFRDFLNKAWNIVKNS